MVYDRTFEWKGPARNKPYERFVESGYKQSARLTQMIEDLTGTPLDSPRALDFGCGVGRLSLPLAERCEHVYGVDVSTDVLRKADEAAKGMNVTNVDWVEAGRLADLSGLYDLVVSVWVFQHIPVPEGERTFEMIVRGLRPGGAGAIDFVLRPSRPLRQLLRWTSKSLLSREHTFKLLRGWVYMLMRSYSLNRIGRLLAAAGIDDWHVHFTPVSAPRSYDSALVVFRKG